MLGSWAQRRSPQVTLGQDYLPSRVGTASRITLGLAVSIDGLASPVIGSHADATSLQTALAPLILMPVLCRLLFRAPPEPAAPRLEAAPQADAASTNISSPSAQQSDHR